MNETPRWQKTIIITAPTSDSDSVTLILHPSIIHSDPSGKARFRGRVGLARVATAVYADALQKLQHYKSSDPKDRAGPVRVAIAEYADCLL